MRQIFESQEVRHYFHIGFIVDNHSFRLLDRPLSDMIFGGMAGDPLYYAVQISGCDTKRRRIAAHPFHPPELIVQLQIKAFVEADIKAFAFFPITNDGLPFHIQQEHPQ